MARELASDEIRSSSSSSEEEDYAGLGVQAGGVVDFDEDTAALTIVQVVYDGQRLAAGEADKTVIVSRFCVAMGLYILTLFVQIYLLAQVKAFVCAQSVHDVRIVYDKYEEVMYAINGNLSATPDSCYHMTVNGKHRGKPECFHPENFDLYMEEEEKAQACRITLTQPMFLGTVLFLWTVTCLAELQKACKSFRCLIINTRTKESMETAFNGKYEDEGKVIHSLTLSMKIVLSMFCILPRIGITIYLLWVGCRWLLATDGFADLILNAVALEFILLIKELLYVAMVPRRIAADLSNTKMLPTQSKLNASLYQAVEVLFWLLLAVGWVWVYMFHLQAVLPEYKWDVRAVCTHWIVKRYAV